MSSPEKTNSLYNRCLVKKKKHSGSKIQLCAMQGLLAKKEEEEWGNKWRLSEQNKPGLSLLLSKVAIKGEKHNIPEI